MPSASASVRATASKSTPVPGNHVHPGQQVGEGVVAARPRRGDGLVLGDARGQPAADHAVEQQVGGVAEDPRDHDADDGAQRCSARSPQRPCAVAAQAVSPGGRPSPRSSAGRMAGGAARAAASPRSPRATHFGVQRLRFGELPVGRRSPPAAIRACPRRRTRPSSTTITWSASMMVEMRCATTITVASAAISASLARTSASVCTSSAENASSNT